MVDLPKRKVGIVACSGEELPGGTVTRLAVLKVLEQLRPAETVTICLPLFLAGGEADRAFAKFYPTITVDGCGLRCAARGTERYSHQPAASLAVNELVEQNGLEQPQGLRRLNAAGMQAVDLLAEQIAGQVDEILERSWNRRSGEFTVIANQNEVATPIQVEAAGATCACGSGIPVQELLVGDQPITVVALPVFMQQFKEAGKPPGSETTSELLEFLKIYNPIPANLEEDYREALAQAYQAYLDREARR